jgi:hypothetical protein
MAGRRNAAMDGLSGTLERNCTFHGFMEYNARHWMKRRHPIQQVFRVRPRFSGLENTSLHR